MMQKLSFIFLNGLLFLGCMPDLFENAFGKCQGPGISRIEVRLPGKAAIKDDNLLKIILDPNRIASLVAYADRQLSFGSGWISEGEGAPHVFIRLLFFEDQTYKRNIGICHSDDRGFYVGIHDNKKYRIRYITEDEKKEFFSLVEDTEAEYMRLLREKSVPGPWKK